MVGAEAPQAKAHTVASTPVRAALAAKAAR